MVLQKLPSTAQWFNYTDGVRVQILHNLSPEYKKRERKRNRDQLESVRGDLSALDDRDDLEATIEVGQAEDFVTAWEGVAIETADGQIISVPVEDRRMIFENPEYADFTTWIRNIGFSVAEHKAKARRAIAGNSNGTSTG